MGHVEVLCALWLRQFEDFCPVLRRNSHWDVGGGVSASVGSWPNPVR